MRIILFCILFLLSFTSWCCSALIFTEKSPSLVAVNLDWPAREMGVLVIHPRHQTQTARVDTKRYHPLTWTSQYGSVIFHGLGVDAAVLGPSADGINEKGLMASVLVLDGSEYEVNETKPGLNNGLWVQYILDNFQSVDEVLIHASDYQLVPERYHHRLIKLHMLIHDRTGHYAILEYNSGKLIIYKEEQLSYPLLTNIAYEQGVNKLPLYSPFGGTQPLPGEYDPTSRFIRAAATLKRLPTPIAEEDKIAYAFNALADVAQPVGTNSVTQVSMIFDIPHLKLYFRTVNEAAIRYLALDEINFDHLEKLQIMDAYQHQSGNILKQRPGQDSNL